MTDFDRSPLRSACAWRFLGTIGSTSIIPLMFLLSWLSFEKLVTRSLISCNQSKWANLAYPTPFFHGRPSFKAGWTPFFSSLIVCSNPHVSCFKLKKSKPSSVSHVFSCFFNQTSNPKNCQNFWIHHCFDASWRVFRQRRTAPCLASKLMLHNGVAASWLPVKTVKAVGATKDLGR